MDTIAVRDAGVPAAAPSLAAPVVGPARDRSLLAAAVLLVVGQLVLRGWLVAQRHYYADDLRLLQLADGSALFSPSYLLDDYAGHFMPGAFLVAGLVERAGPLEWWPAAVSLVALQTLASLALLRLLWILVGARPLLLVPLAVGLFTPMTLGNVTWWAAGLNSIPLQIGLAWYVADAVQLARTGRRRYALSGTAALAFTFAFYLKAVLLPPVAVMVVALVLFRDGARSPLRSALRRGWALWTGTVIVTGAWVVTYLSTREDDPLAVGTAGDVLVTISTGVRVVAPVVLSGPFRWVAFPSGTPLSNPPTWTVVAGVLVLLAAFVWTCVRRRGALAVWLLTSGLVVAGLLMAALGRSRLGLGEVAPLAFRYFAADAVLLPVAGALLATLPLRARFHRGPGGSPRASRPGTTAVTVLLTACFVAGSVQSTISHARAWEGDQAGEYLDTVRASLAAAGPAPLLDQAVSPEVVPAADGPANLASRVLAPLRDRPEFSSATSELQIIDDTGRLVPATLWQWGGVGPGPVAGCGYPVPQGQPATLPLYYPLLDGDWTLRLDATSARDGVLTVALDGGELVEAPITAGSSTVFVRLSGQVSALQVGTAVDGLDACVTGAVLGLTVP